MTEDPREDREYMEQMRKDEEDRRVIGGAENDGWYCTRCKTFHPGAPCPEAGKPVEVQPEPTENAGPVIRKLQEDVATRDGYVEWAKGEIDRLKVALGGAGVCPNCVDQGWFTDADPNTGEPVQVQCQWCYETGHSLFNRFRKPMERLKAENERLKATLQDC